MKIKVLVLQLLAVSCCLQAQDKLSPDFGLGASSGQYDNGRWSALGHTVFPCIQECRLPALNPNMILVKGGSFDMGDAFREGGDEEIPVHRVSVSDFYLAKYETTFAEYDAFCDATHREKPEDEGWGRGDRPVIHVSWEDAVAYCEWLSKTTGLAYRLPTEAEWEFAARERGRKVRCANGQDTINSAQINFKATAYFKQDYSDIGLDRQKTVPVIELNNTNSLGFCHMAGNVWEWCSDWFDKEYYSSGESDNPKGPATGFYKVMRGGSWLYGPMGCRATHRFNWEPAEQLSSGGFRVACSPKK